MSKSGTMANAALALSLASVVLSIVGMVCIGNASGWEGLALFYGLLLVLGVLLCLCVVFAAMAISGSSRKKALLSAYASVVAVGGVYVSMGGTSFPP